jgi:hypothetical protein
MLDMNRSAANTNDSTPRRFILLPEEAADGVVSRPRIRRYQLTRVGRGGAPRRRTGLDEAELGTARRVVTARMAFELGRLNGS